MCAESVYVAVEVAGSVDATTCSLVCYGACRGWYLKSEGSTDVDGFFNYLQGFVKVRHDKIEAFTIGALL